jgi:hypothetical protein
MRRKKTSDEMGDAKSHIVFMSASRRRTGDNIGSFTNFSERTSGSSAGTSLIQSNNRNEKKGTTIKPFTKMSYFKHRNKIDIPHIRLAKLVMGLIVVFRFQKRMRQSTIIKRMEYMHISLFDDDDKQETNELLYETRMMFDIVKMHKELISRNEYKDQYFLELEERVFLRGIIAEATKIGGWARNFFIAKK